LRVQRLVIAIAIFQIIIGAVQIQVLIMSRLHFLRTFNNNEFK